MLQVCYTLNTIKHNSELANTATMRIGWWGLVMLVMWRFVHWQWNSNRPAKVPPRRYTIADTIADTIANTIASGQSLAVVSSEDETSQ